MSLSKEHHLWIASAIGGLALVKDLLASLSFNPERRLDLTEQTPPFLPRAGCFGHIQVVEVLLQHPEVEVNVENEGFIFNMPCQQRELSSGEVFMVY